MSDRTCSECGTSIADRHWQAKTCGTKCRSARHTRLVRIKMQQEKRSIKSFAAAADDKVKSDIVKQVVREQVEPVVRAALANETLAAISSMVNLVPQAIEALEEDLLGDDPVIRQRAYSLLIKYTAGHPAIVRPDDATGASQMVVNFNLPRPDAPDTNDYEAEAIVVKTCDLCGIEKPSTEMVAGASRCQECMDRWKQEITESVRA